MVPSLAASDATLILSLALTRSLFPKTSQRQTGELIDSSATIVGFLRLPETLVSGMPKQSSVSESLVKGSIASIPKCAECIYGLYFRPRNESGVRKDNAGKKKKICSLPLPVYRSSRGLQQDPGCVAELPTRPGLWKRLERPNTRW